MNRNYRVTVNGIVPQPSTTLVKSELQHQKIE